jgi:hypothetical protein
LNVWFALRAAGCPLIRANHSGLAQTISVSRKPMTVRASQVGHAQTMETTILLAQNAAERRTVSWKPVSRGFLLQLWFIVP